MPVVFGSCSPSVPSSFSPWHPDSVLLSGLSFVALLSTGAKTFLVLCCCGRRVHSSPSVRTPARTSCSNSSVVLILKLGCLLKSSQASSSFSWNRCFSSACSLEISASSQILHLLVLELLSHRSLVTAVCFDVETQRLFNWEQLRLELARLIVGVLHDTLVQG